jgi:hypothetical protein
VVVAFLELDVRRLKLSAGIEERALVLLDRAIDIRHRQSHMIKRFELHDSSYLVRW